METCLRANDFDTLNLNSTTSDKGNKITADLDTQELNFSLDINFNSSW